MRRLLTAGPVAWAVLALGLGAAVLMVLTEFSTIQTIRIGESTCGAADADVQNLCQTSGGDAHGYALLALGVLVALLTLGAAAGRSRPAAVGLVIAGVVVLGIAFLLDRPDLDNTRGLDARYSQIDPQTGGGYTLERLAGLMALVAGGVALGGERLRPRSRRREAEAAGSSA